jgi:hypothetical protein
MINCGVGAGQRFDRDAAKFCLSLSEYDLFTDYSFQPSSASKDVSAGYRRAFLRVVVRPAGYISGRLALYSGKHKRRRGPRGAARGRNRETAG